MAYENTEEIILLDTHIWVWAANHDRRLDDEYLQIINSNPKKLCISVVSCWEVSMLVSKGRLLLDLPLVDWFDKAIERADITLLPLTPHIAAEAYALPGTFHQDPADRLIVATARKNTCLLLTEDAKIRKYRHVRTA